MSTDNIQIHAEYVFGIASIGEFKRKLQGICQNWINDPDDFFYQIWAANQTVEFQGELVMFENMVRHHSDLAKVLLKHGRLKYVPFMAIKPENDPWWHVRSVGSSSAIRCHETDLPCDTIKGSVFPWDKLDKVIADYQPQLASEERAARYWMFVTPMSYLASKWAA